MNVRTLLTSMKLNPVVRYDYYKVLCEKMKLRRDIIRDNRKIKIKLERQSLPITLRVQEYITDNQKKCLAFLALLAVMQYYEIFYHTYKYIRSIEPMNRKLKRWVLGVNNLPPPTIVEQTYTVTLEPQSIKILEQLFQYLEQQFQYGVNRKFLYTVYDELQLFDKVEERLSFYRQSGYYKKRNQKLCAVHCLQFVTLFDEAMIKLKKKDPSVQESDVLRRFTDTAMATIDQIQQWERTIDTKRAEYRKLTPHLQDHKVRQMKIILESDPYITFEEIDRKLSENGLMGMSIKDKIMINFQQLQLHQVLLDSYQQKLDRYIGSTKELRLRSKVEKYQERVSYYRDRQEDLNHTFNLLFKKQELFPISQ